MNDHSKANPRIAGVLLAAGRSRRMGALKQTLPWPPENRKANATIISSAYDAIAPVCQRISLIVGRDADAVLAALGQRPFTRIDADSDDEMLASICAGLRAAMNINARDDDRERAFDAALIQPGDHPGVARTTINQLLATWREHPHMAVMPEHAGKGGHPVIIPLGRIPDILACAGDQPGDHGGLRRIWLDHPDWRVRVAVDDPLCIRDVDTPEDYSRGQDAPFGLV